MNLSKCVCVEQIYHGNSSVFVIRQSNNDLVMKVSKNLEEEKRILDLLTVKCNYLHWGRCEMPKVGKPIVVTGNYQCLVFERALMSLSSIDSSISVEKILVDVAACLESLHSHNLVHADVKDANVLYMPDDRLVLIDFGMCSSNPSTVGTVGFQPPECFNGGKVTAASDIWSLGMIVYARLYGNPFCNSQAAMDKWYATRWNRLSNKPIDSLIKRMLHSDPAERPSASQVLEMLK